MLHSVALQAKQSCVSEFGRHKKHNTLLPAFLIPALLCMFQNIPKQKDSTSEPSRWGGTVQSVVGFLHLWEKSS